MCPWGSVLLGQLPQQQVYLPIGPSQLQWYLCQLSCWGACLGTSCVCLNGQTNCNGVCKDLSIDPNNCGTCGHVCNATNGTAFCSAGACGISCNAGFGN